MIFRVLSGLMFLLFSMQSFAAEILVIQSYHKEYAWDKAYVKALKEKLGIDHKLSFFEMDTKRLQSQNIRNELMQRGRNINQKNLTMLF